MRLRERLGELHPRRFFLETWREMDREAAEERATWRAAHPTQYDYRPLVALLSGAVFLTLMEYPGMPSGLYWLVKRITGVPFADSGFAQHQFGRLGMHGWWAFWRVLGFFLLPALTIKLCGGRLSDNGLGGQGLRSHLWIYALAFVVVLICVIIVSYTDEFATYYPFYDLANRSWADFCAWELMYAAQFFSLEFFFRGWWLSTCKRAMGSHAIFVMVVPYVMIHFGKPAAETISATIAGLVLGTLAMKTRSIWSGFLIHVSVAISMDMAALLQTRGLPVALWP